MKAIFAAILAVALASSFAEAGVGTAAVADGALGAGALGAAGLAGLTDIIAKVGAADKAVIAAIATALGVDGAIAETIVTGLGIAAVPVILAIAVAGVPIAAGALFAPGLGFGLHHFGFGFPDGAAHLAGAAALAALLKPFLMTPLAAAAPALFAAPKLPVAGAALPLASPGLLSAAAATAPAALTGATFPLLLAAPWLNAIFTLVAPALFAGPALTAPAEIAALSVAPFVKTAITAPLLPAADPLSAALRDILVLTYNIGFFAPSILFAALPILIPVIQKELWAGPLVAFLTSTLFPVAAKTAAVATSGLHGATIAANKIVQ